jgi:hypothetical protein
MITNFAARKTGLIPAWLLALAMTSGVVLAEDLSKYRDFQLGADIATIAKQTNTNPSQVKTIHQRPALIQELELDRQAIGPSSTEALRDLVFTFYEGKLFRIRVTYDRYQIVGLTTADLVDAISAKYGAAERPPVKTSITEGAYGDREEILAQWQDSQHRFELIQSSYGPTFKLVGISKTLEALARTAAAEAKRLDDKEAPQREAARLASEGAEAKAGLEKARLANKPKFRP